MYNTIAQDISSDILLQNIKILNETLLDMKRFSNPKMLLELALIKIMTISNSIEETSSTSKIAQIEQKQLDNQTIVKPLETGKQINENKTKEVDVKQRQINISREIKDDDNDASEITKWKEIRVNNTLSKFSKKYLLEIKQNLNCDEYLLDDHFNQLASLIMDGTLKAASDEYLIFVYKTSHLSESFNEHIDKIEDFLKQVLSNSYKVVAVAEDEWNIIKEEFNKKEKEYIYQNETININDIINKRKNQKEDDMKNLFGDLVEYN